MVFMFILVLLILVFNIKFYNSKFCDNYLAKNNTAIVNGFFIILVFFSHFQQYITATNNLDIIF